MFWPNGAFRICFDSINIFQTLVALVDLVILIEEQLGVLVILVRIGFEQNNRVLLDLVYKKSWTPKQLWEHKLEKCTSYGYSDSLLCHVRNSDNFHILNTFDCFNVNIYFIPKYLITQCIQKLQNNELITDGEIGNHCVYNWYTYSYYFIRLCLRLHFSMGLLGHSLVEWKLFTHTWFIHILTLI